jgi:hypothetical protein
VRVEAQLNLANLQFDRSRQAVLEMYKLWFEAHKNQTVLSSGAVVAYAAVTAALIQVPTRTSA